MKILVIDVGGTHLKLLSSGRRTAVKIPSGPTLTPAQMVKRVKAATEGWAYDALSIGFPSPVRNGKPLHEPIHLGRGWVRFDFERAFGCPVRVINDAAMQALGSYAGGRMLFLGLGTGLGSATIDNGHLAPMELGHLPYLKGKTFEEYLGTAGLKRLGRKRWQRHVHDVTARLRAALVCDYVVLGGGNSRKLKAIPPQARLGDNANAFVGGFRLWQSAAERTRIGKRPAARKSPTK